MTRTCENLESGHFQLYADEQIGTKEKAWYRRGPELWLWKEARPGTGEAWAEDLAAQLALLVGVPAAHVEPCVASGKVGTLSSKFLAPHEHLIHGNEVLFDANPAYPLAKVRMVVEHTVPTVLKHLEHVGPAEPGSAPGACAASDFTGYLMLDAWILNVDRHHQNWAIIRGVDNHLRLAPSYDHASSLGRELTSEAHRLRLSPRDKRAGLLAYIQRARSAFFDNGAAVHPVEAWRSALAWRPKDGQAWRERLDAVSQVAVDRAIDNEPAGWMSDDTKVFVRELLRATRAPVGRRHPMTIPREFLVAWRSPVAERWFPVAEAIVSAGRHEFRYLNGVRKATSVGFAPFPGMEEVDQLYTSGELFPLLENRIPPKTRSSYESYVRMLNLTTDASPLDVLARTGGRRVTDSLEVFERPVPTQTAEFDVHFFVHGSRFWFQPPAGLEEGQLLCVMHDVQNKQDPNCLVLRTDPQRGAVQDVIGYVPAYLTHDIRCLLELAPKVRFALARVNTLASPHMRYLARVTAPWPQAFRPFSSEDFRPVATPARAA